MIIKGTILGSYGDLTGKYDTMGKCDGGSLWDAIGEYRVLMKWIYIYIIYISWSLYIGVRFLPKWDSLRCVDEFLMNVRCPFFSHLFGTPFPAMASLMEKR